MLSLFPKTDLCPRQIFVLKLLLIYILLVHRGIFVKAFGHFPYLPFIHVLEYVPALLFTTLIGLLFILIVAALLKMGNYRLLSFSSGLIVLLLILSSKPLFSNSLTFVACLLILIGLTKKNSTLFRLQISLLYLGAATNKLFDPDWLNGHYFDYFLRELFNVEIYSTRVSPGDLKIATLLSVFTIFIEFLLGILALVPRFTRLMIISGLFFHGGMLVVTSGELSARFLFIMSAAFLLISRISFQSITIHSTSRWTGYLMRIFDFSDTIKIVRNNQMANASFNREDRLFRSKAIAKFLNSRRLLLQFYFLAILCYLVYPFILNKIIFPAIQAL